MLKKLYVFNIDYLTTEYFTLLVTNCTLRDSYRVIIERKEKCCGN